MTKENKERLFATIIGFLISSVIVNKIFEKQKEEQEQREKEILDKVKELDFTPEVHFDINLD